MKGTEHVMFVDITWYFDFLIFFYAYTVAILSMLNKRLATAL